MVARLDSVPILLIVIIEFPNNHKSQIVPAGKYHFD